MWRLRPHSFDRLHRWEEDDHAAALAAFSRHADRPPGLRYRHGEIGISPETLEPLFAAAREPAALSDPQRFFERNFRPYEVIPDADAGRVTAFFEPEVAASEIRTERHSMPFYRRPPDLVSIDDGNRPSGWDGSLRFGRIDEKGTITPYPDRAEINAGYLEGQGLEIAWADPVDVFFAHIQGAACLRFDDGTVKRVTYAAKSGHSFTGIGGFLIERGEIPASDIGMRSIRNWLANHPDRASSIMERNRSYIFFEESGAASQSGPIAAAKIPLSAGRSLAVDRLLHTFGTPVYVDASSVNGERWSRLMIAQDTGSAIVGPARGDLFMGTGRSAGLLASDVNSPAAFAILVPNSMSISADP